MLLLFIFTNVHGMSIMGKPRLTNESWAAKARFSYECKIEFYKIMYFIIILNCDWFPDRKKFTVSAKLYLQQGCIVLMKNMYHGLLQFGVLFGVFFVFVLFWVFLGHGFSIIYDNSFRTALESWVLNVFIRSGVPACNLNGKEDKCLRRLSSTATGKLEGEKFLQLDVTVKS